MDIDRLAETPPEELLNLRGHPVAYFPKYAHVLGGVNPALLISQLHYWRLKTMDPDGWIYRTMEQLQAETGMTKEEQRGARFNLKRLGLLEEKRKGIPPKNHYRVDWHKLVLMLLQDGREQPDLHLQTSENPMFEHRETLPSNVGKPDVYKIETKDQIKTPSKKKEVNPDVAVFLKWWCERYKLLLKDEYLVQWGREGKAVKDLLKTRPLEEVKRRAERLLTTTDRWLRQHRTIPMLLSKWNDLGQLGSSEPEEQEGPSLRIL